MLRLGYILATPTLLKSRTKEKQHPSNIQFHYLSIEENTGGGGYSLKIKT